LKAVSRLLALSGAERPFASGKKVENGKLFISMFLCRILLNR
jgi:hypothetical protein